MNILVTSVGRRVKIVEYIKNVIAPIKGKVIATDCNPNAPALYFADKYEIVPRINETEYINTIIKICKNNNITGVISLIDPELELLASLREEFETHSIQLILSPVEIVKIAFDKFETYNYLYNKGIPAVPTYNDLATVDKLLENKSISFPLVVKPAKGSASLGINIVSNIYELNEAFNKHKEQVVQPFYKDKEFGIDVYVDMVNGKLIDLFIKEKLNMRAGETDKSLSVHNDQIEVLVKELISKTNFSGPIDIDCFEYNGNYYISEINPRFGGGYPHAYEMGCDFMTYIVNNLMGKINPTYSSYTYKPNYIMMKYDNIKLIEPDKK